jgi:hypothetical protein
MIDVLFSLFILLVHGELKLWLTQFDIIRQYSQEVFCCLKWIVVSSSLASEYEYVQLLVAFTPIQINQGAAFLVTFVEKLLVEFQTLVEFL